MKKQAIEHFARLIAVAVAGIVMLVYIGVGLAQQQPAQRSINKIAGDLYRFQNNFHYSVFLVTPAGIIVTDPIDANAAKWLKAEIATRFNQPIISSNY